VVLLHCAGYTNKEVAKQTNYHPVHVANILNAPQAQVTIQKFSERLTETILSDLPGRRARLIQKSYDRIEEALDNEALNEKAPLQMASLGISLLKGLGSLNDGGLTINQNNTQNNLSLPEGVAQDLVAALREANTVRDTHKAIPDAEFDLVGTGKARPTLTLDRPESDKRESKAS
jgi:hypothetical protein